MQYYLLFLTTFLVFILFFKKIFIALLSFFDGLFLAFMCFCFLPMVLEGEFFWINSMLLVLGVLISSYMEQKTYSFYYGTKKYGMFHCIVFLTAYLCFQYINMEKSVISLLFSFLSGLFLLMACGGILPEECNGKQKMKLAMLGMVGFLLGILLIFPI
ncbi:hypothetical protein AAK894_01935 [Lachnospiraceae bacterium 46-61]